MVIHPASILFITLDSCRYDTFESAEAPNLKRIGKLYRAMAPGNFTYSSHAAMFMGFTPGVASAREPFVNPKYRKIFKIVNAGYPGKGGEFLLLGEDNIVSGLKAIGYRTIGSGAVGWFNPSVATGRVLTRDFDDYFFDGSPSLSKQLEFVAEHVQAHLNRPVFVFINVGETHVPYYYKGAPWDSGINPCVPFADTNDAAECRRRQITCLEFVDRELAVLLTEFENANIIVCSDHGDAWGEDGLWEHGISHPKVLEVPLLFRLRNPNEPLE